MLSAIAEPEDVPHAEVRRILNEISDSLKVHKLILVVTLDGHYHVEAEPQ